MSNNTDKILLNYISEPPSVIGNLRRILNHGRLANTGKIIILPIDQGFEHGPDKSFYSNIKAYDPIYHFKLAINTGLSGIAGPYGFLSLGASEYCGKIPMILKLNSSNSLNPKSRDPDQAFTSSVKDAVYLGCSAVGITIYPGSQNCNDMLEEAGEIIKEARDYGLPTVIWSYPRGEDLTKEEHNAIDITAYASHIACLLGGHIIKVKPPSNFVSKFIQKSFFDEKAFTEVSTRINHIVNSSFQGKRLVIFSGGEAKSDEDILDEIREIKLGGGNGSIIGRNIFQRSYEDAEKLVDNICKIYLDNL